MYPDIEAKSQKFEQLAVKALKATNTQDIEDILDALVEHSRETYNACLCALGPNNAITKDAFTQLKKAIIIAESSKGKE